MRLKKLLFLFVFIIGSLPLFAQSGKIQGIVTDSNGETLPGVNVSIEGTTKGGATNNEGYYFINNVEPGTYTLKASFIGFKTVLIENVRVGINLTTDVDFELFEETFEGEEVVVVASQPVVRRDVSSSTATIAKEDIEALPVTSVTAVIGLQAGVEGLSVRGSGADEVAFNVNGFSLRSERNNTPFTGISVTSIENVQVQTGGFNAEYGDIRSGLIDVTTKEGERDRYTLDGLFRLTPPQAKNFGQSVNSPDSYWIRPFIDNDVAWTGTNNGAWDKYTREDYAPFEGWNSISRASLADNNPNNDITPEAAQQAFLWQHRKVTDITSPDYEIDLTLGGPFPFISDKLGDLRFSTSFRETKTEYFIPLSRDDYKETTFQTKITSNVGEGMKLSFSGLYGRQAGTGSSQAGFPGFFVSPAGIASSMDLVSFIDTRIYSTDYWAPTEVINYNFGGQFTHSLSNRTFYEVKLNTFGTNNSTNPGRARDTTAVVSFGGVGFDEGPFGFFNDVSAGIGSGMRMGIGMSTSRDSTKISGINASFQITSQLNRVNQVKAGVEIIRTNSKANYGTVEPKFPTSNVNNRWDTTPVRASIFAQNKLEFKGMIANVGLRLTYSDPNLNWFDFQEFDDVFRPGFADNLDSLSRVDVKPQVVLQPRLGVSFPVTENSKLYFNYGHFLQLPTPENLYLIRREPATNTITRIASPENPLPKTVSYELGYEHNILDKYLVRVAGYYKDLSQQPQLVTYRGTNSETYTISEPFSYEDIRGLELTLRRQPSKFFWGEVNYTYDIRSRGLFGTLQNFENNSAQRDYDRTNSENDIFRPVPSPFARMTLFLNTPSDFGGEFFGIKPLANWQVNSILTWRAGSYLTYTGGGSIEGVSNNLQMKDSWNTTLRLNKTVVLNSRQNLRFFMDVSNVLNTKYFNVFNAGFVDGNDYLAYMGSLHLPLNKLEEINRQNVSVPGKDQPGDYRKLGVEYTPIQVTTDLNTVASGNRDQRSLYYNSLEKKYYQYRNGQFVDADQDFVNDVLENKAYINMPNQRFFNFFNPRTFRFGVRFSF